MGEEGVLIFYSIDVVKTYLISSYIGPLHFYINKILLKLINALTFTLF